MATDAGHALPLTGVAARYADDHRDDLDIYLSQWLARQDKLIFGLVYLFGILFTAALWAQPAGVRHQSSVRNVSERHGGAQPAAPVPVLPDSLKWFSPPNNALLRAAWVLGTEKGAGTYVLRVALARGGRIPPHTHPDTRNSTVLSGTLYVGFGDVADDARVVVVPAGGLYVVPAHVAHYLWARDGDVVYQESGVGPTGTIPVSGAHRLP